VVRPNGGFVPPDAPLRHIRTVAVDASLRREGAGRKLRRPPLPFSAFPEPHVAEASFEIVVAGGGPAGSAAAIALARAGRRVLLLDDAVPGAFRVGEGLAPAARRLLRDLGLLERVAPDGHLPCPGNVSAWGSPELAETDFIYNLDGPGWHLDRARFDASLRAAARDAGAAVREQARIAGAARADGRWRVTLADGEALECAWLIDATGRRAAIARRHGAERVYDDGLVAFFARFRAPDGSADHDARTMVEAAPDGWWYTARVPEGRRVVAFLTDADLADRALLAPEGFAERLAQTEHVVDVLAAHGYAFEERPRGADAGSARLDRFVGDGWVGAGDAAVSFDPLSSQGIMTAMYTGMRAGQALAAHLDGDAAALDAYAARVEEVYAAYLRGRLEFYAYETRWADRPFWARRRTAGGTPSGAADGGANETVASGGADA
jgi:flavin-dependent dehydrogenase